MTQCVCAFVYWYCWNYFGLVYGV